MQEGYAVALAALIREASRALIPAFLFRWHGSAERARAFLDIVAEMPACRGPGFWRCAAACWASFDAIPHRDFASECRAHRHGWKPDAMAGNDRAAFDALPKLLTIYRGQDAGDTRGRWHTPALGLAWTLRCNVAEGIAPTATPALPSTWHALAGHPWRSCARIAMRRR